MPLRYTYADAYVASFVTASREDAAAAYVSELGTFPAFWTQQLITLKAYCITCEESMKSAEDVWSAKLSVYRKSLAEALPLARAAQRATEEADGTAPTSGGSVFSMTLERG